MMLTACLGSPLTARAGTANILTTLHSFEGPRDGLGPNGALVQGSDGNFYGTTQYGGSFGDLGGVFKITPAGVVTPLYSFTGTTDGSMPTAGLVRAGDGNFYGTTGGAYPLDGAGTVFKITPAGKLTTLYQFPAKAYPNSLLQGSDGNFYGTTSGNGDDNNGTVFKLTPTGVLTTLHPFSGGTDGSSPSALVQGSDGAFYGTTGGYTEATPYGTVFKLTPAGGLTTLHTFKGGTDGREPLAGLVRAGDGNFYGSTAYGGPPSNAFGYGTLFKITPAGVLTTIYNFKNGADGSYPATALVQGSDGNFYGTAAHSYDPAIVGTVFKVTPAGVLTALHHFRDNPDGSSPEGALVQGSDGAFYGATYEGGIFDVTYGNGLGTIYKITSAGALSIVHRFYDTPTGTNPSTPLTLGRDGNLYGTTFHGGVPGGLGSEGYGTVFKITPDHVLTTLYTFDPALEGAGFGRLVQGNDGNLYGTTGEDATANPYGSVYKLTPGGVLTVLYSFRGGTDGALPTLSFQGRDGNFYGTTSDFTTGGQGTVFKLTPAGVLTTLYRFTGMADESAPSALLQGSDGNFYGTTNPNVIGSDGTVFKLTPVGVLTTLYTFSPSSGATGPNGLIQGRDGNFYGTASGDTDAVFKLTPAGTFTLLHTLKSATEGADLNGLTQGTDGNFYGLATYTGTNNYSPGGGGTAFEITPTGTFTVLHTFNGGGRYGLVPEGTLVQDGEGTFYGTTQEGGDYGQGSVFQLRLYTVGYVAFSAANYAANEDAGSVTISVVRTVSNEGVASVAYSTADGTARAGVDYRAASGSLTWADGDGSVKSFSVPIIDRGLSDNTKRTISLTLSTPHGICLLGSPSTATLTITEDDPKPAH